MPPSALMRSCPALTCPESVLERSWLVDSRKRIAAGQLGGSVRPSRAASSGRSRNKPGSAGISDSARWTAHAGWVKSPVPTTVTPFRLPTRQAAESRRPCCRHGRTASGYAGPRGTRRLILPCSAGPAQASGAAWSVTRAWIGPRPSFSRVPRRGSVSGLRACAASRPVMSNNARRGIGAAKEEAPA